MIMIYVIMIWQFVSDRSDSNLSPVQAVLYGLGKLQYAVYAAVGAKNHLQVDPFQLLEYQMVVAGGLTLVLGLTDLILTKDRRPPLYRLCVPWLNLYLL